MAWETEYTARKKSTRHDYVDYTRHQYQYPELQLTPPTHGEYPELQPLKEPPPMKKPKMWNVHERHSTTFIET